LEAWILCRKEEGFLAYFKKREYSDELVAVEITARNVEKLKSVLTSLLPPHSRLQTRSALLPPPIHPSSSPHPSTLLASSRLQGVPQSTQLPSNPSGFVYPERDSRSRREGVAMGSSFVEGGESKGCWCSHRGRYGKLRRW